jgi:hypothetical protein
VNGQEKVTFLKGKKSEKKEGLVSIRLTPNPPTKAQQIQVACSSRQSVAIIDLSSRGVAKRALEKKREKEK